MDIISCIGEEVSPRFFLLGVENVFFLRKKLSCTHDKCCPNSNGDSFLILL